MRFLAIFQVKPKTGDSVCEEVVFDEPSNAYLVNGWKIKAESDASKPPKIEAKNDGETASFISTGFIYFEMEKYNGEVTGSSKLIEKINGESVF